MSAYNYQPTLLPADCFDAWSDAQILREAMKGLGTDEEAIVDILATRVSYQRLEIANVYKTQYGRDLIDDLKNELKGNFEDIVLALMTPTTDYLATHVHKAISGAGTDEATLIEILIPLTPSEMTELKAAYERLYEKSLEEALKSEADGHFQKLLVSLSTAGRDMDADVNEELAAEDAKAIFDAGEGQWGTEESVFMTALACRSFPQLNLTFDEYLKLSSKNIETAIESELSGDYSDGLLAIVKCARNTPEFFATRLYKSMKGLGTDDDTLIRIIVTRCELDMKLVKQEFEKQYGKTLQSFIADDTSGDYKKILLKLVTD